MLRIPKIPKGRPCVQPIAPIWSIPCLCPWHSMTLFWPPWLVISPEVDWDKVGDPIIVIANEGGQWSNDHQMLSTNCWNINLKGASGQEVRRSPVGQGGSSTPLESFNETPTTRHCVFEISINSLSVMKCESQRSFCIWKCLCHMLVCTTQTPESGVPYPPESSNRRGSSPWRPCVGTQVKIWLSMPRLRHGWTEWNFRPLGRKKSHKNSEREEKNDVKTSDALTPCTERLKQKRVAKLMKCQQLIFVQFCQFE